MASVQSVRAVTKGANLTAHIYPKRARSNESPVPAGDEQVAGDETVASDAGYAGPRR
jgi:hypothetical protein